MTGLHLELGAFMAGQLKEQWRKGVPAPPPPGGCLHPVHLLEQLVLTIPRLVPILKNQGTVSLSGPKTRSPVTGLVRARVGLRPVEVLGLALAGLVPDVYPGLLLEGHDGEAVGVTLAVPASMQ